jgi:hypothetical protein
MVRIHYRQRYSTPDRLRTPHLTPSALWAGLLTFFGQKRDEFMSQSGAGMYAQRDYFGKDR